MPHPPKFRHPGVVLGQAAAVKGAAVVAGLAIGASLLASCSPSATGSGGPVSNSGTAAPDSPETQIRQVTQDYITAVNLGKMTDVPALICSRLAHTIPGDGEDLPESTKKAQIDRFLSITINAGTATALLTVSVTDDSQPPQTVDMLFVDEDGWKLCQ